MKFETKRKIIEHISHMLGFLHFPKCLAAKIYFKGMNQMNNLKCFVNTIVGTKYLNIGGGPKFCHVFWENLDEVKSSANKRPCILSPNVKFPFNDRSMELVYTSHCIEHLDDPTVDRVLREGFRVLKKGGDFIIKIPDFDKALELWKKRRKEFFTHELLATSSIKDTWKNRGIRDCLDYRAAMLFCGFWNKEYGDHFFNKIIKSKLAYHGPPVVSERYLQSLIKKSTPHQVSKRLESIVLRDENNFKFNHRNAWGRKELEQLISSIGYRVKSFDIEKIIKNFKNIPEIDAYPERSAYFWIKKDR